VWGYQPVMKLLAERLGEGDRVAGRQRVEVGRARRGIPSVGNDVAAPLVSDEKYKVRRLGIHGIRDKN
jgi:hypothetical protein